ncbi:MAG: M50 family metallopeptidase, partial [Bacteroidota bacterium]|nr:M50 family metallopeptidase [Bacteroidota bacterium]
GKKIENFGKIPEEVIINGAKNILVKRGNDQVLITIPKGFVKKLIDSKNHLFISPRIPFDIGGFVSNSAGKKAGIMVGDKIVGINDVKTEYFDEFRAEILKHKNQDITVKLIRKGANKEINVHVPKEGLLGIMPDSYDKYFSFKKIDYNIISAIPAGTVKAFAAVSGYVKQFKLIFSKEVKGYESVGGFIAIGNIFPSVWDWHSFWGLTAFLSIILAFMNVLPIPALDGGHVLFLTYELVSGRKPSDKFLEYAQYAGMILLLALLVYANGNDIYKLFK